MKLPFARPKIPVVQLRGIIAARPGMLNLEGCAPALARGFALAKKSRKLVLAIESPGGSATQSDLIGQRIRRKAEAEKIEVTAVIGDLGASGGYWLACAADRIYASRLSIVGSIGVVTEGFGFSEFIARHGIERRTLTAGAHKRRNDMFAPRQPEDTAFTQDLLDEVHEMFKDWVRARRGAKLTQDESQIFDGGFMLGERAKTLGLIDGFADVEQVVRELGGEKAKPVWLRPRPPRGLMRLILRNTVEAALDVAEERAATPILR
ncbi:S49 family peptidase [Acidocella sp.]|uniref:S49 family peptidase n=1 Tax=Acidocella sp. TaxID=50710 RepID=UPI003D077F55